MIDACLAPPAAIDMIDPCLSTPAAALAVIAAVVAVVTPASGLLQKAGVIPEKPASLTQASWRQKLVVTVAAVCFCALTGWYWQSSKEIPYLLQTQLWDSSGSLGDSSALALRSWQPFDVVAGCGLDDDQLQPTVAWLEPLLDDYQGEVKLGVDAFSGPDNEIDDHLQNLLQTSVAEIESPVIRIYAAADIYEAVKLNAAEAGRNPVFQGGLERDPEMHVIIKGTYQRS